MAAIVLLNAFSFVDGHDFTADTNAIRANANATVLPVPNFAGGGWQENIGGAKSVAFNMVGYWSAGTGGVDPDVWTPFGNTGQVCTFGPAATETGVAYMFQGRSFNYQLLGEYNTAAPFTLQHAGSSSHGMIRGQLGKARGNVSATGALGSGLQLGAVGAAQYLYATFHVFTPGTTITVVVQSDDNAGFTTPTTRATIGPITLAGGTWATRVAGAITDTYYRFNVTAITGTFNVAGAIGIGS